MAEVRQIWCAEDKMYYPEIKTENGRTYKLDPETFVYLEQVELGLTDEEQQLRKADFIVVAVPTPVNFDHTRKQYAEKNPRPKTTFTEIERWEKTRSFIVEHEVMEQIVLQRRG